MNSPCDIFLTIGFQQPWKYIFWQVQIFAKISGAFYLLGSFPRTNTSKKIIGSLYAKINYILDIMT